MLRIGRKPPVGRGNPATGRVPVAAALRRLGFRAAGGPCGCRLALPGDLGDA